MPKAWPIPRKGTTFIAGATHARTKSLSLIFIVRDILGLARNKKEVKFLLANGEVKVNNQIRKDEKFPVQVFDTVSFEKTGKVYRLLISKKKFKLEETTAKDAETKVVKVISKKVLSGKKSQMNLEDGRNFLYEKEFAIGDSVVVNTKTGKIEKILPLKSGASVEVVSGKHAGEKGKLVDSKVLERTKMYKIKLKNKEVELPLKTLLVIE
jgi:small subunit ribosomal protein S4e